MALGTITGLALDNQHNASAVKVAVGDQFLTVTTVVGDSSYPTNGSSLTPANLGLAGVNFAICSVTGSASNNAAIHASYDIANQKLKMWSGTTLAETANSTNVSGLTITVLAFGY